MTVKHTIYTRNDQKKETITPAMRALIKRAITAALAYERFEGAAEVSVTFVDNEKIRTLNRAYRNQDAATDVLSFPILDDEDEDEFDRDLANDTAVLGDIVLSVERAREQAAQFGHSLDRELAFLSVHSTLHLLGYDHELSDADDRDMRHRQTEILKTMGLERVSESNETETEN